MHKLAASKKTNENEANKMKIISAKILMLLISGLSYGQDNSEFINSIKRMIIQEKIPVYDLNYDKLKNDEISIQFIWIDTIINDVWTRPKYIDNIYREPFDGMTVKTKIVLDTVSDKLNPNYLSFFTKEYDDAGNYLGDRIVFKTSKLLAPKEDRNVRNKTRKSKLKRIYKKWETYEIKRLGEKIQLDSCHKLFRIEFGEKKYRQYYMPSNYECFTKEMKNHLRIGIEGDSENLEHFYDKINGPNIENREGEWYTFKDRLILESEDGLPIITFKIKEIRNKKLVLKIEEINYEIKLKEASR